MPELRSDENAHGAVEVTDREIPGPHGPIPIRIYRRRGVLNTAPGLVWNHGGSFVEGDLDMPEAHWVSMSLAERGSVVVSVSYRLCSEFVHFPIPSDDVLAAYRWVAAHTEELGIDPDCLTLGGASAGSCLAGGVAKRLRDSAGPQPRSVLLVYPIVHPFLPDPSPDLAATIAAMDSSDIFSTEILKTMRTTYLGSTPTNDPYAYPANGSLAGLPPTLVLNVESDNLRASGEAYAAALAADGVDVLMLREDDAKHGHINRPEESAAQRSVERMATWLAGSALVGTQHPVRTDS